MDSRHRPRRDWDLRPLSTARFLARLRPLCLSEQPLWARFQSAIEAHLRRQIWRLDDYSDLTDYRVRFRVALGGDIEREQSMTQSYSHSSWIPLLVCAALSFGVCF